MNSKLVLVSTWIASNQNLVKAVALGAMLALGIAGMMSPEIALAGPATGGSH